MALSNLCTPVVAVITIVVAYTISARIAFWCWRLRGLMGPIVARTNRE